MKHCALLYFLSNRNPALLRGDPRYRFKACSYFVSQELFHKGPKSLAKPLSQNLLLLFLYTNSLPDHPDGAPDHPGYARIVRTLLRIIRVMCALHHKTMMVEAGSSGRCPGSFGLCPDHPGNLAPIFTEPWWM